MENVAQHDCRVKRRLHSQFSILNSEFHLVPRDGREFWRSLDEWADTPEFRAWLADEFPGG